MKVKYYCFCGIILLGADFVRAEDTIPEHQLDELIIVGERGWVENGYINIIPTKQEKRLSNSPATLVRAMHLPFLKEKDGEIVGMSGESVSIFINGEKAESIDIDTFWPREVQRVEYIENPSGPAYEGAKVVLNFIMARYETGGVSRVNLFQRVPNNGRYSASSKLVYRKMTYGAMISGNYYRDHRTSMIGETEFRDIFYDGIRYDRILRSEDNSGFNRDEGIRCAVNARYATDRTRMTHTFSLGWDRNPGSGSNSVDSWSANLFGSSQSSTYSTSKSISPQILGNYYFRLSDRWHFSGEWFYSYSENISSSCSVFGDSEAVRNSSHEDVSSCRFTLFPSFMLSDRLAFQLKVNAALDWYSTLYVGSADTRMHQSRQEISTVLIITWRPYPSLNLTFDPGATVSLWSIDGFDRHLIYPTAGTSINWNPYRKLYVNGSLRFYMAPPTASESNPVLVRSSDLMWVLGNPELNNLTSWDTYIHTTYLLSRWLSISLGFGYVRTYDSIVSTYTPATENMGGLIRQNVNSGPTDNMRGNIELRASFINDNLSVGISPQWHGTKTRGTYGDTLSQFSLSGSADYTIGDFRIGIWYDGPYRDLSAAGMERSWRQDTWNLSAVYGNGNLYIECRVEDILNTRSKSWLKFTSPNYSTYYDRLETGRRFSMNLTYTFGYGKKVDNSIDISGPEVSKSNVLNYK